MGVVFYSTPWLCVTVPVALTMTGIVVDSVMIITYRVLPRDIARKFLRRKDYRMVRMANIRGTSTYS